MGQPLLREGRKRKKVKKTDTYSVTFRGESGTYTIYKKANSKQEVREQLKKDGYNLDNVISIIQDIRLY